MDAFAIYRLPHTGHCSLVGQDGVPSSFSSLSELGDDGGFVIAPFHVGDTLPILLLRPDVLRRCLPDEVPAMQDLFYHPGSQNQSSHTVTREDYHNDFSRFHQAFSEYGFQKLVLARSEDTRHDGTHPASLFARACERYPEAFVALFSAPQCGTWLVATPEVLLSREHDAWRTMALAGTMPYSDELLQWSDKNVQEQEYVARYIKDCLDNYCDDVKMVGPYTTQSGMLAHLRTDFSFSLTDKANVGNVLDALHPTPAVCGLPKEKAQCFIVDNETCDRSYYSGFSGPLNLDGDTAMFVTLRCMRIMEDCYRLYAGGGILPQSEESLEWDETAAKMQAMLSLID